MIHKLILKNFKRIKEETFDFNQFDLIVGANNSGKSTALQALAIWQYCVDQFNLSKRNLQDIKNKDNKKLMKDYNKIVNKYNKPIEKIDNRN
jgi:AAA15 family ATPase/GTPase